MQIFPDTSPDRPVYLSCECGERLTLTAPPEIWPLPCPVCGKNVKVVDPETVRAPEEDPGRLLDGPEQAGAISTRRGGSLVRRDEDLSVRGFIEEGESIEITSLSFTGKPKRERVVVRAPEVWGMESLALAIWLATAFGLMIVHASIMKGHFTPVSLLVQSAIFAVVTSLFVLIQKPIVAPTLRAPISPRFFLLLAASLIPVTVGIVLLYSAALNGLSGSSSSDPLQQLLGDRKASTPLLVLAVGVLPGFFEELGFRGWMQSLWRKVVSPNRALVLTAVAFAVLHFSYWSIAWILPMGLYLGWLRERSKSIWPGVIAHMGHNTAMVLVAQYFH